MTFAPELHSALLLLLGLLAWGAHAWVPWWLARGVGSEQERWWWCRLAPILFLVGVTGLALRLAADPERTVVAGIGALGSGSRATLLLAAGLAALAVGDGLLAFARERLESAGWLLLGGLGVVGLALVSWTEELLRSGGLAREGAGALLLVAALRSGIALAAGDFWVAGKPRASLVSGIFLALYPLALAGDLRAALWAGGDLLTLGAGALLLAMAPLLPARGHGLSARLGKVAVGAGLALAALALARIAAVAGEMARLSP